jgi:hypothetical protein
MIVRFSTKGTLSLIQAESFLSKLIYSIEGGCQCYLEDETQEVVIEIMDDSLLPEISKTINTMIQEEIGIRTLKSRTVQNNIESAIYDTNHLSNHDYNEEDLYSSDGTIKKGDVVELLQKIDQLFVKLAGKRKAEFRKYPSMIPLSTLNKCGYIRSFPQNIFQVSEFPHQYSELRKLKEMSDINSILRPSLFALSPAVCFHCYAELSGQIIANPTILTAMGNCFRHEAPWRLGNHRLNEFSMREIVFVGEPEFVEKERAWWMSEIWTLFNDLSLLGKIHTANDPFYFSEDAPKSQHQMMATMKYELTVKLRKGGLFSIASFNNMRDSLCKPFEILNPSGRPLQSGCVAFGIDRWMYALLSENGPFRDWPAKIKKIVNGE